MAPFNRFEMRLHTFALLGCLGCATSTGVVPFAPTKYQPRPKDYSIALYSAQLPTCPFEEIAIVSARAEYNFVSTGAVAEALRKKARQLGGDALVRVGFVDSHDTISGTVIRFKRDDCKQ